MREKNDFEIDESEMQAALDILENTPIALEEALANPKMSVDKIKKLISLMEFCDFIKIKNGEIYQIGLSRIE